MHLDGSWIFLEEAEFQSRQRETLEYIQKRKNAEDRESGRFRDVDFYLEWTETEEDPEHRRLGLRFRKKSHAVWEVSILKIRLSFEAENARINFEWSLKNPSRVTLSQDDSEAMNLRIPVILNGKSRESMLPVKAASSGYSRSAAKLKLTQDGTVTVSCLVNSIRSTAIGDCVTIKAQTEF